MTRLPTLIGLCGKSGCGKDVAADYLRSRFGYENYKLSGPLKRGLAALLGISDVDVENGKDREFFGVSIRRMLQTLGTEWGRETIGQDVWIELLREELNNDRPPFVVVSDIRFDNEAEWIRSRGGIVVRINRSQGRDVPAHVSEGGVSPGLVDCTVNNDSDIATFLRRFRGQLEVMADYLVADFE